MKQKLAACGLALTLCTGLLGGAAAQQAPSNRSEAPPPPPPYAAPKADASLAVAGSYRADKAHTSVTARIRREGLSNFTFRFDRVDATFTYDPAKPEQTFLLATLDPVSVDGNNRNWNEHLIAADLLNVEKFMQISYVATQFKRTGPTTGVLSGNVTFLGIVKPMSLEVILDGIAPGARTVIGFSGHGAIKMADFPMPGFAALHLGGDVDFAIEAEFVKS